MDDPLQALSANLPEGTELNDALKEAFQKTISGLEQNKSRLLDQYKKSQAQLERARPLLDAGIDPDEYQTMKQRLQEQEEKERQVKESQMIEKGEVDKLRAEYQRQFDEREKTLTKKAQDSLKAAEERALRLQSAVEKSALEGTLRRVFSEQGVLSDYIDDAVLRVMTLERANLKAEIDDEYNIDARHNMIPLADWAAEVAASEAFKKYRGAPVNAGGGVAGSGQIGARKNGKLSPEQLDSMTPEQIREAYHAGRMQ